MTRSAAPDVAPDIAPVTAAPGAPVAPGSLGWHLAELTRLLAEARDALADSAPPAPRDNGGVPDGGGARNAGEVPEGGGARDAAAPGPADWGGGLAARAIRGEAEPDPIPGDRARRLRQEALMRHAVEWEGLLRVAEAAGLWVAGEIADDSAHGLGEAGLARAQNFRSARELLCALTGASRAEISRRIRLAAQTRPVGRSLSAPPESPLPALWAALQAGELGQDAARVIAARLLPARRRVSDAVFAEAERVLVAEAVAVSGGLRLAADELGTLAERILAHLDPDGAEPRNEERRARRSLRLSGAPDGMTRLTGLLDPETAAVWQSILADAERARRRGRSPAPVGATTDAAAPESAAPADPAHEQPHQHQPAHEQALQHQPTHEQPHQHQPAHDEQPHQHHDPGTDVDVRTPAQAALDHLTDILTAHASAAAPQAASSPALISVHVQAADLASGVGIGWIDGLGPAVPISAVERLLCSGRSAATLFGEGGEVLAHGKARRLFSPAQLRALSARDGGCVWPGCPVAPRDCEAHHIAEWRHPDHRPGRTDLDNGVLLCRFHHGHLHRTSWRLRMRGGLPVLVPPREIDPARTARPLGAQRSRPRTRPRPRGAGTGGGNELGELWLRGGPVREPVAS